MDILNGLKKISSFNSAALVLSYPCAVWASNGTSYLTKQTGGALMAEEDALP